MADNIEVMLGRIDERTQNIQTDIVDIKGVIQKIDECLDTHETKIAKLEIMSDTGLSKKQTVKVGGIGGIIGIVITTAVELIMKRFGG